MYLMRLLLVEGSSLSFCKDDSGLCLDSIDLLQVKRTDKRADSEGSLKRAPSYDTTKLRLKDVRTYSRST